MTRDLEQPPSTLPGEDSPGPIPIAVGSELSSLRGFVGRLVAPGFEAPPRLLIAVEPERMAALASSLLLIEEIRPVLKTGCPRAPRLLGILWLGDSCAVEVVGIPADETFAPAWPLVLGGASVVIDACASELPTLRAICEATELTHMAAERLLGEPLDATSPPHVAKLMRAALASVSHFPE
jgi:hypothetical protein